MKRLFLCAFVTLLLVACKEPMETTFTAENKQKLAETIGQSDKVAKDDKTALALYLLRVSGDKDWNADPNDFNAVAVKYASHFPEGKTPKEVVFEQVDYETSQAKQAGMTREEMQSTSGDGDGVTPEMIAQAEKEQAQQAEADQALVIGKDNLSFNENSIQLMVKGLRKAQIIDEKDNQFMVTKAKPGETLMIFDVEITNQTAEPIKVSSMVLSPRLTDSDGYVYDFKLMDNGNLKRALKDGPIAPKSKLRGEIFFAVPVSAKGLKLSPNLITDTTGYAYKVN